MARFLPSAGLLGRFPGLVRLDGLVRFIGTAADLHAHAPHDDILLQHAERVVPAPVDNQAGGETAEHEREDERPQGEDILLDWIRQRWLHLNMAVYGDAHDVSPQAERYYIDVAEYRCSPGQTGKGTERGK